MFNQHSFQLTSPVKQRDNKTFVSISADGSTMAVETENNIITLIWLTDGEFVTKHHEFEQSSHEFGRAFALSPDGQYLATYGERIQRKPYRIEFAIQLWETSKSKIVHEFDWNVVFPTDNFQPRIIRFQFLADGKQLAAFTVRGEVAIWSTINGNLLRFIGQSSHRSHEMVLSHDGKWFVALEDNVEPSQPDHPSALPLGRYYELHGSLYAYQSRVCYNFERHGMPIRRRSFPSVPLGVAYLGRVNEFIFNVCDAYTGEQVRNLAFPIPENVMVDRVRQSWGVQLACDFQLSHDDSILTATVDSNIFLWDTECGDISQIITRDESLRVIGFSQDDRFTICHDKHHLFIWDIHKQVWAETHSIAGEINKATMSDTNRVAASVWNKDQWSIAVIDLSL